MNAANIAPVGVLVVWWVGLPIVCLLARRRHALAEPVPRRGAVVPVDRAPEDADAAGTVVDARPPSSPPSPGTCSPTTARARPALAVFLLAYARGGGRRRLPLGPGVARHRRGVRRALRRRRPHRVAPAASAPPPAGTAALMVVWLGGTAFDALHLHARSGSTSSAPAPAGPARCSTPSGLTWITAIVAGAYLARRARRRARAGRRRPAPSGSPHRSGIALVPLAAGWFLGHDLTLLLSEGQNFLRPAVGPPRAGVGTSSARSTTPSTTRSSRPAGCGWSSWRSSLVGHVRRDRPAARHRRSAARAPRAAMRDDLGDGRGRRPRPSPQRPCWCSHDRTWDAGRRDRCSLAHQGGWDELLFVLVPIALFAGLLAVANRRASRAQAEEPTRADDEE